jgi:formylglycine-generating enzyme required for sulfatase activity
MTYEPARRAGVLAVLSTALFLIVPTCSSPKESEPQDTAATRAEGPAEEPILTDEEIEPAAPTPELEPFTVTLPGTTVDLELVGVPGGTYLTEAGPVEVAPFWMARTETTWDAYDVLVYRLDLPEEQRMGDVDGVSRPTKPYISVDRGFGHEGYPALSLSAHGAQAFCEWLSEATGRSFRLPTTLEFEWAARAMSETPYGCGPVEELSAHAWFRDNSDRKTHPVGERSANAWGLHDLHGNVAEWALDAEGEPVVCGGSWRDSAPKLAADARREPSDAWNASDPQIPKSVWWLADANFVGFRVVCEPD